jgi:hypothetical protein
MRLVRSIRASLLRNHIRKVATDVHRERAAGKFTDLKRMGMVLDGTNDDSISFAMHYRDEQLMAGKTVALMAYVPKMARDKSYLMPFFTDKETNWYGKPTNGEIKHFLSQPFDVLVNISPELIMPLEYLCALSVAKYIIGNGTGHLNTYYDCLIKVNDSHSYSSLMENVHHYLNLQA